MGKTFQCWRQYGHQSTSLQLTYNLQEQAPAKEENMALTNRTLILLKYFWETTDEAHPISLTDISAHLKEHGITADPRTLRSDIEQLVEFGVDIVKERRVQNLYHVATRHFEAPEVKLLIDAVQSARFITPGKSKELVKRLTTFVAPGNAALPERHLYIDSRVKAVNESVYISVDHIQTAIAERRKIAFRYFDYSPSKERVHRNGGKVYSVSTYALLRNNDSYYLVGFHEHRQQIAKFHVDRIDDLERCFIPALLLTMSLKASATPSKSAER